MKNEIHLPIGVGDNLIWNMLKRKEDDPVIYISNKPGTGYLVIELVDTVNDKHFSMMVAPEELEHARTIIGGMERILAQMSSEQQ